MRRVQIHLEEDLDRAASVEAARRGVSKAALIRASLARELADATWAPITGWLEDGGVDQVDDVVYEPGPSLASRTSADRKGAADARAALNSSWRESDIALWVPIGP